MHKNWLIITFLVVAVVGLYFVWENAPVGVQQAQEAPLGERFPQSYLTGADVAQFRADGSLEFRFHSERIDYYQRDSDHRDDDYATVDAPMITFYDANADETQAFPDWYLTAEQGHATQNFKMVELSGDVKVWQPKTSQYQIAIDTSYLNLDTESQFAHSEEPVMIRFTNATSQGVGFEAKLKEELITILSKQSKGRTVYEPTPP